MLILQFNLPVRSVRPLWQLKNKGTEKLPIMLHVPILSLKKLLRILEEKSDYWDLTTRCYAKWFVETNLIQLWLKYIPLIGMLKMAGSNQGSVRYVLSNKNSNWGLLKSVSFIGRSFFVLAGNFGVAVFFERPLKITATIATPRC